MVRCALAWSFQKAGSSANLFSSARRRVAVSTSKMPPQQPDRLLDVFNQVVSFRAHRLVHAAWRRRLINAVGAALSESLSRGDLTARGRKRNLRPPARGLPQYSPPVPERTARPDSGET